MQQKSTELSKRKKGKDSTFYALSSAGVSSETLKAAITPVQAEIDVIEIEVEGWKSFLTGLNTVVTI